MFLPANVTVLFFFQAFRLTVSYVNILISGTFQTYHPNIFSFPSPVHPGKENKSVFIRKIICKSLISSLKLI